MKKFQLIIFVLFLVISLFGSSLFSQTVKTLSLDDCIKTALDRNSQLRNANRDIKLADADVTTYRSVLLPNINASFSSGKYIQGERRRKYDVPVGVDSLTGDILYEQKDISQAKVERNSHYASISLTQNIWDWGRSWCQLSQSKNVKKSIELSYLDKRNFVVYDVNEKYFELLKAIKLGEVYEEAVKRSEEQYKKIESMYKIGSRALADVYKAKVALGNDKKQLIMQKNIIIDSYANLNNSMGLDPNSPLEIEVLDIRMLPLPYSLDEAIDLSYEKNNDLKKAELTVKNYKFGKRIAKLAYLPTLGGMMRYSRDNEYFDRVYSKNLNEDYSISMGLQIDLNIFKGFADKAEFSRQSIQYDKANENLKEKQRVIKASVVHAFNILNANKEIALINDENLESAMEDLRLAQASYEIGAGTMLEIIDAQFAVTQAKSSLVRARYDYQIALAYLNYTIGITDN